MNVGIYISQDQCGYMRKDEGKKTLTIQPWPINFDIDKCDGCSMWWICQMINNNRKALEEHRNNAHKN